MNDAHSQAAHEACQLALNAIKDLDICESHTPFSQWYRGAHAKTRSAARKAVLALEQFATSDEEREVIRLFLSNLRNKVTRSPELRRALEGYGVTR
jgi:hypothetical protein